MYRIMCFTKTGQQPYGASFKDEESAKSVGENIHARRKQWLESGKDCLINLVGNDYGYIEILASEITASMLLFAPDGIQLAPGTMGRA